MRSNHIVETPGDSSIETCGGLIDSLPRVGSTSLANVLNAHPEIKVLIEPFHPRRYRGIFLSDAIALRSVVPVLRSIWDRFSVIKHVWEENAWPFEGQPLLNEQVVLAATRVISLRRKNLLQRYVSNVLSRRLNFWIGKRQEFIDRLERIQLQEFHPPRVLRSLQRDSNAVKQRNTLLSNKREPVLILEYEQLFGATVTDDEQFAKVNEIVTFLGFRPYTEEEYMERAAMFFKRDVYCWADEDLYRRLPNGRELDQELRLKGFGCLFE